jgi:hypothetical protein
MGVGALLGGVAALRTRPRRPLVVAGVGFSLFVFPLAFLALGAPLVIIAAGALLGGAAMMFGNSVWESTLQANVPEEALGRVSAYDWFGSLALSPLGMAIWGPIAVAIGLHEALWLAVVSLLVVNGALLATPAIRQLRA